MRIAKLRKLYICLIILILSVSYSKANSLPEFYNATVDSIYDILCLEDKISCIVIAKEDSFNLSLQSLVCNHSSFVDSCRSESVWANVDHLLNDTVSGTSINKNLVKSALIRGENSELLSLFNQWLAISDNNGFYYDIDSPYALLFANTDISLLSYFYVPYGRLLSPIISENKFDDYFSVDVYQYPSKVLSSHKMNRLENEFNQQYSDSQSFSILEGTSWLNYERLMEERNSPSVETVLSQGAIFVSKNKKEVQEDLLRLINSKVLDESQIEFSCKNSLLQQYLYSKDKLSKTTSCNQTQLSENINIRIKRQGSILLESDGIIPVNKLSERKIAAIHLGSEKETPFLKMLKHYANIESFSVDELSDNKTKKLSKSIASSNTIILAITEDWLQAYKVKKANGKLKQLLTNHDVVISYFGDGTSLSKLTNAVKYNALSMSFEADTLSQECMAQMIMGGIGANGILPFDIDKKFVFGTGVKTNKCRLSYAPSYYAANTDSLANIDKIVYKAIRERATPGCQVLVAKGGDIIYNKSFGYHTYDKKTHVNNANLYDIASITKVTASIPSLMKMYDEGILHLEDSLAMHLPRIEGTNKSGMQIGDMLVHQAGLQAWIPFYMRALDLEKVRGKLYSNRYSANYNIRVDKHLYMNKTARFRTDVFRTTKTAQANVKVCDKMYMNSAWIDSVKIAIDTSSVRLPAKYRYSDLAYYYYREIIERTYNKPLQDFVQDNFYKNLGAERLTYLPLEKYSKKEIMPSENDLQWRKEVVQGYVHDPGAAMLGGVGGHAGLFANAESLVKVYQMYLQQGSYGGEQYFKPETIELFTSTYKDGNRRGLGFDKPETDREKASPSCPETSASSYGHSGFTGTLVWVDPEYDLIYIFLSNRVYPRQYNKKLITSNVRTSIHSAIYHSLPEFWERNKIIDK